MPLEEWADELRNREDVLPVRHRPQHAPLDPLAVGENALLMAARAEVARLAGKGEQQVVAAPAAADTREAAVQVAAFEEALEHVVLDGAAHAPRRAQLRQVAVDALTQRARARSALAIDPRAIVSAVRRSSKLPSQFRGVEKVRREMRAGRRAASFPERPRG